MIEIPEHIKAIIEKGFLHQESSTEMSLLKSWCDENPENKDEYERLQQLWNDSSEVLEDRQYDVARAWNTVDKRLRPSLQETNDTATPVRGINRNLLSKRLAVAAALSGIIIVVGWLISSTRSPNLQIVQALASQKTVTLPDGTIVFLRKGATLRYPSHFDKSRRAVTLEGEAFFKVQHDPALPFRIETKRSFVQVLGTSFLVNATNNSDRVVVATGRVMFSDKTVVSKKCVLSAKQEAVLTDDGFAQKILQDSNYLSWQTGILKYVATPINVVAKELSEYYGIEIVLNDSLVSHAGIYTITGTFDCNRQSVEQVLEEIAAFTRLHYVKQKDAFILFEP